MKYSISYKSLYASLLGNDYVLSLLWVNFSNKCLINTNIRKLVMFIKKSGRKIVWIIGLVILLLILTAFSGCFGKNGLRSIIIVGSTTVLPIAQEAADNWLDNHPEDNIGISPGGSTVGVKSVGEGTADIGLSSRELKSYEISEFPNLKQFVIAKDGIALIVNKANRITNLNIEQVRKIYSGQYSNWQNLGGPDLVIEVIGRDTASGTRTSFDELVMADKEVISSMKTKNSNGAVHTTVRETPGAIGYVSLGYVDDAVKGLKINGVDPTVKNIQDGNYTLSRNLSMFTDGEPQGLAKEFITFVLSEEGQSIIEKEGFVPLK